MRHYFLLTYVCLAFIICTKVSADSCNYVAQELLLKRSDSEICVSFGLNDKGQVVGECVTATPVKNGSAVNAERYFVYGDITSRATYIWSPEGAEYLDSLRFPFENDYVSEYYVKQINNNSQVTIASRNFAYIYENKQVSQIAPTTSYFDEEPRTNNLGTVYYTQSDESSDVAICSGSKDQPAPTCYSTYHSPTRYAPSGFQLTDVNDLGTAVAWVYEGKQYGYTVKDGVWKALKFSGKGMSPTTINNNGLIGGWAYASNWDVMPYVWIGGRPKAVKIPYSNRPGGGHQNVGTIRHINDRGEMLLIGGKFSDRPLKSGGAFVLKGSSVCVPYEPIKSLFKQKSVTGNVKDFNNSGQVLIDVATGRKKGIVRTFLLSPAAAS